MFKVPWKFLDISQLFPIKPPLCLYVALIKLVNPNLKIKVITIRKKNFNCRFVVLIFGNHYKHCIIWNNDSYSKKGYRKIAENKILLKVPVTFRRIMYSFFLEKIPFLTFSSKIINVNSLRNPINGLVWNLVVRWKYRILFERSKPEKFLLVVLLLFLIYLVCRRKGTFEGVKNVIKIELFLISINLV